MSNPVRNTRKIEGLAVGGSSANHQLQVFEISLIMGRLRTSDAAAKDRYLSSSTLECFHHRHKVEPGSKLFEVYPICFIQ